MKKADKGSHSDRRIAREQQARKQAELLLEERSRALYLANQELEASLSTLKEAQAQLVQSEKMASVGQLAAGIAHEINNPAGFVSSNLSTLKEYVADICRLMRAYQELELSISQPRSSEKSCAVEQVALENIAKLKAEIDIDYLVGDFDELLVDSQEGIQRIKKIVADLSDFSRAGSKETMVCDINALIEKTLRLTAREIKYKGSIITNLTALPPIRCYPELIGQVMLNLVINAIHALDDGGKITISTFDEGDFVRVDVCDDGCGISISDLNRIFDPFFTTKQVGKGTGLGLHIVRDIVRQHGGEITVESVKGEGAVFFILAEGQRTCGPSGCLEYGLSFVYTSRLSHCMNSVFAQEQRFVFSGK